MLLRFAALADDQAAQHSQLFMGWYMAVELKSNVFIRRHETKAPHPTPGELQHEHGIETRQHERVPHGVGIFQNDLHLLAPPCPNHPWLESEGLAFARKLCSAVQFNSAEAARLLARGRHDLVLLHGVFRNESRIDLGERPGRARQCPNHSNG